MNRDITEIATSELTTVTGGASPQSCDDAFAAWTAAKRTNVKDAEGVWSSYGTSSLPGALAKEGRSKTDADKAFKAVKRMGCFSFTGNEP